ncbi:MAG: GNAT family N-acetyltransferase [Chloroflexota bacterium]
MSTPIKTNDSVIVKNTPSIPGLTFRKFRGEADYPVMAELTNAANQVDGDDYLASVEDIRSNYAHLERSDTDKDMLFVEFEGQAVGYGRCTWDVERNGDYLYKFFIKQHPDWRADGIPLAMIEFFQKRLIEISAKHPPEAPKYFHTWGQKGVKWHEEMMERLGINPVRHTISMLRPCSQPVEDHPLPEGIEVRPVASNDYRKVYDADVESFRDYWGKITPTEKEYQRFLNQPTFDPSLWKVAWEGDQVVGMVLNYIDHSENKKFNRRRGYTEGISVRHPWRRQGIARSLLTQSIRMFQEIGMDETSLGVYDDNHNGPKELYQSVGYQETRRCVIYRAQII